LGNSSAFIHTFVFIQFSFAPHPFEELVIHFNQNKKHMQHNLLQVVKKLTAPRGGADLYSRFKIMYSVGFKKKL
jgi:hypothetical protein